MAQQDRDLARLRRKLTRPHRFKMAKFAVEKFRCPELRAAEAAAQQKIADLFVRDALAIPKSEIKALERHDFARRVEGLTLPHEITTRETAERTFTKPNGEIVTRQSGDSRTIWAPSFDEDGDLPYFESWHFATRAQPERNKRTSNHRTIRFDKPVSVPSDTKGVTLYMRWEPKQRVGFTLDSTTTNFLSEEIAPAIVAFFIAADARILEERRLICAAIKVIDSCETYGQVLDFWPEVEAIEDKLFDPITLPPSVALVALSDADKAALCANMASRGVASVACQRQAA